MTNEPHPTTPEPAGEGTELEHVKDMKHLAIFGAAALARFSNSDGMPPETASAMCRTAVQIRDKASTLGPAGDGTSPGLLRHYKKAAHDIGDLFCWCVENIKDPKFLASPDGNWIAELKDILASRDAELAKVRGERDHFAETGNMVDARSHGPLIPSDHAYGMRCKCHCVNCVETHLRQLEQQLAARDAELETLRGERTSAKCGTCGGSGKIESDSGLNTRGRPCPDCTMLLRAQLTQAQQEAAAMREQFADSPDGEYQALNEKRLKDSTPAPDPLRERLETAMVRLGKAVLAGGPPDDIGPPADVAEEYYAASDDVKRLAVHMANAALMPKEQHNG